MRAAHGVEEHPLSVDGAIERAPAPGDVHVGLVQGPGAAGAAPTLRAPPIREQRSDAALLGADRLVAAREAALEEPLGDVPDAEPTLSKAPLRQPKLGQATDMRAFDLFTFERRPSLVFSWLASGTSIASHRH